MYLLTHQLKLTHVSKKGPWNQINILRYTNIIIEHFWPCRLFYVSRFANYCWIIRTTNPGHIILVQMYSFTYTRDVGRSRARVTYRDGETWIPVSIYYLSLFEDGLCHWKICNAMSHRLNDWFLTVHRHDSVNIVMWLYVTFFTNMV